MSLHLGIIYTILARHFSTCCIFFNKFVQCNSGRIPYWAIRLSSQWGSFEQITFNRKRVTNTEPDFSFKGAKIEDWDMLIAYHKLLSIFQMLMLLYLFVRKKNLHLLSIYIFFWPLQNYFLLMIETTHISNVYDICAFAAYITKAICDNMQPL